MTPAIKNGKPVRCPLCFRDMESKVAPIRKIELFVCHFDQVAIAAIDPFVNRWDEALAKTDPVPCPNCNAGMRYFATSTGYMKARCPSKGCGAAIETMEPDRDGLAKEKAAALPGEVVAAVDRPISTPDDTGTLQ